MRKGKNNNNKVLKTLQKQSIFKVPKLKNIWIKVQNDEIKNIYIRTNTNRP